MARAPLPIATGFYKSDSLPLAAQECVNWYVNIPQGPALNKESLFGAPGSVQLTPGEGLREINRGAKILKGLPYFINGNVLYRLERTVVGDLETFTVTALGVIEGTGRVSVAQNGTQLCIQVPDGKGYIFTATPDTLTEITDLDFRANGNPRHVAYVDGYFAFTTDTSKWIVSEPNDGLSYNALDFSTAEADPDDPVVPIVYRNQLFIAGTITLEAFQNIGGADFPFQRTGLFVEKGVSAPFSAIKASDRFMFIGKGENESPAIWELSGAQAVKVSTTAIDSILHSFTEQEVSDAFSWSYAAKGAYFVGFALPGTTLVYDLITEEWAERKSQIINFQGVTQTVRNRVNSIVSGYGRILVGDSQDGRIGAYDPALFDEYGQPIIRVAATQPFQNNMLPFSVPYLELTVESGVGNSAVPDPVIRMDSSLDGKTWKDQRTRRIGKKGQFKNRCIWRRNGQAERFETFRFTQSDAVKPVIIQLTADIVSA